MAKIQSFRRIIKEDVPQEFQPLIDKIGNNINTFADEVVNALNNNLTISDNLNMQYKDIEVTVDSKGKPIVETSYKSTLNSTTKGIIVIKADNGTSTSTYPISQPFVTFSQNGSIVTIINVSGLQAGNKYTLRLEARG